MSVTIYNCSFAVLKLSSKTYCINLWQLLIVAYWIRYKTITCILLRFDFSLTALLPMLFEIYIGFNKVGDFLMSV